MVSTVVNFFRHSGAQNILHITLSRDYVVNDAQAFWSRVYRGFLIDLFVFELVNGYDQLEFCTDGQQQISIGISVTRFKVTKNIWPGMIWLATSGVKFSKTDDFVGIRNRNIHGISSHQDKISTIIYWKAQWDQSVSHWFRILRFTWQKAILDGKITPNSLLSVEVFPFQ